MSVVIDGLDKKEWWIHIYLVFDGLERKEWRIYIQ